MRKQFRQDGYMGYPWVDIDIIYMGSKDVRCVSDVLALKKDLYSPHVALPAAAQLIAESWGVA